MNLEPRFNTPVTLEEQYLASRTAKCYASSHESAEELQNAMMAPVQPSSTYLPFYEYRGPGSIWALNFCGDCQMGKSLHYDATRSGHRACSNFVERGPAEFDSFYCGCRGLD